MNRSDRRKLSWHLARSSSKLVTTGDALGQVGGRPRYSLPSRKSTALLSRCCGLLLGTLLANGIALGQIKESEKGRQQKSHPVVVCAPPSPLFDSGLSPASRRDDSPKTRVKTVQVRRTSVAVSARESAKVTPGDAPQEAPRMWLDIRPRSVDKASPEIIPAEELPSDVSSLAEPTAFVDLASLYTAELGPSDFCVSGAFCHWPLYFEDRDLERYGAINGVWGHGMLSCVPAVHSGLKFFGQTAALPLSMWHVPPHHRVGSGCIIR
jgi:hypothetical protein